MASSKEKLAALKLQYGSQDQNANGGNRETFTNNYFPFWNMKTGEKCIVRFLPDKDESNPRGFMMEVASHNLSIAGQNKKVPCLSMYNEACPVCKVSQDYYTAVDKINGKKYWRQKQYGAQALIIEDPLEADATTGEKHTGNVRFIRLSFQIYNIIKEAFASDDLEGIPYDFEDGYDFVIKKTQQGEYASYATGTKFQTRQRALTEDELITAEEGMVELSSLMSKHPGTEKVQAMLNADLNGEEYDDGKPSAPTTPKPPAVKTAKPKVAAPVDGDDEDPPFEPTNSTKKPAAKAAPAEDGANDVDDMLAQIRARRQAK